MVSIPSKDEIEKVKNYVDFIKENKSTNKKDLNELKKTAAVIWNLSIHYSQNYADKEESITNCKV
jgi:hypothetical protein